MNGRIEITSLKLIMSAGGGATTQAVYADIVGGWGYGAVRRASCARLPGEWDAESFAAEIKRRRNATPRNESAP